MKQGQVKHMKFLNIIIFSLSAYLSVTAFASSEQTTPPLPDRSYTHAKFQPSYSTCIEQSGGATYKLQSCMDAEYSYHKQRVEQSFARIISQPDSVKKDKLMDEIANWWSDSEKYCTWDPKTEGQGQMLDAQSCSLNRVANLAEKIKNN